MKTRALFITGTDTGVGKTVLASLLTRLLREQGIRVAALKPVCSGGREDAWILHTALGGALTLDEINPWHFRAALAPLLAARHERRTLRRRQVLAHVRKIQTRFPVVLIEGAGGLLSPLGEDFDSRDLIGALGALPIVVCPNRVGAINQALLVLAALPRRRAQHAQVVLVSRERADLASRHNRRLLAERLDPARVHELPWLKPPGRRGRALANRRGLAVVGSLARSAGL